MPLGAADRESAAVRGPGEVQGLVADSRGTHDVEVAVQEDSLAPRVHSPTASTEWSGDHSRTWATPGSVDLADRSPGRGVDHDEVLPGSSSSPSAHSSRREPSGVQALHHTPVAGQSGDGSSIGSTTRWTISRVRVSTMAVPNPWVIATSRRSGLTATDDPKAKSPIPGLTLTRSSSRPDLGSRNNAATFPADGPGPKGVRAGATTTRPGSTTWIRFEIHRSPGLP